jgi:release factor glutamine methyltransferase
VLRRVAAEAARWLAPGGHLLVEMNEKQAPLAADAVAAGHLLPRIATSQRFYSTVVIGTRPVPVSA